MTARTTLDLLQQQADSAGRYGPRGHSFQAGEPSLHFNKYVVTRFLGDIAIVDMVHFLVVGARGEAVGGLLEFIQIIENPPSAMDPQDFFSNWLGAQFFRSQVPRFYNATSGALSDQLRAFFNAYAVGRITFQSPTAGMPAVSAATRGRLLAHRSEAVSVQQFIAFVVNVEHWLAARA